MTDSDPIESLLWAVSVVDAYDHLNDAAGSAMSLLGREPELKHLVKELQEVRDTIDRHISQAIYVQERAVRIARGEPAGFETIAEMMAAVETLRENVSDGGIAYMRALMTLKWDHLILSEDIERLRETYAE